MINYQLVTQPVDLINNQLNLKVAEVNEYFEWFLKIKTNRLKYIMSDIIPHKAPTFSLIKLQAFQYMLENELKVIKKSHEEISYERENLPEEIRNIHTI